MTTLNTPNDASTGLSSMQDKLTGRLARLRRRIRSQIILDGVARALGFIVAMLLLGLVLDHWLQISVAMRLVYWLITLAGGAHFIYHYTLKPLRLPLGPIELAEAIDVASGVEAEAQIAPRVATVLQLPAMLDDGEATSASMIQTAVSSSYDALTKRDDFEQHVSSKHLSLCGSGVMLALAVPVMVCLLMGGELSGIWAKRWLLMQDTSWPRNTNIEIEGLVDGKLIVPAGESTAIRAFITTEDGEENDNAQFSSSPRIGGKKTHSLERFEEGDYRLELPGITSPVEATLRSGDQRLRFEIVPVPRPVLADRTLSYTHPADGIKREFNFDGSSGEPNLLSHNAVELRLTANVAIAEARYADIKDAPGADPETGVGASEIERIDEKTFVIRWQHDAPVRFRVEFISEDADLISQPIPFSIGLLNDRAPKVRLRSSGVRTRITTHARIPLAIEARDDLGLTDINIEIARDRPGDDDDAGSFEPYNIFAAPRGDDGRPTSELPKTRNRDIELHVGEYGVVPTDVIRITGIALDDRYTGVQRGQSTTLTFRIVTDDDLLREILARQQQTRGSYELVIEKARDIHQALLLAQSGPEAFAQARTARNIQREIWKLTRAFEATALEMELNGLLTETGEDENAPEETASERMRRQIIQPLGQLHDGIMAQQRDALSGANRGADDAQIAAMAQRQAEMIAKMEAILREMDNWDQIIALVNQLDRIIRTHTGLRGQIEKLLEDQLRENEENIFD